MATFKPPDSVRIILASESPRRKEMLRSLGIKFTTFKPDIPETWTEKENPEAVATRLAAAKTEKYPGKSELVIGMDTLVVVQRKKLAKPSSESEARAMLRLLSGRSHTVITGVALSWKGKLVTGASTTKVTFRSISPDEIGWYLKTGEPFDKAGGYAIQGQGKIFVKSIEGCYYNVIGFPLTLFQKLLIRYKVSILDLMNNRSPETV